MDEFFYFAIASILLGLFFLYLSNATKETKSKQLRVGDKQPKDLRKTALAMIAMGFLFLFVALLGYYFGRSN